MQANHHIKASYHPDLRPGSYHSHHWFQTQERGMYQFSLVEIVTHIFFVDIKSWIQVQIHSSIHANRVFSCPNLRRKARHMPLESGSGNARWQRNLTVMSSRIFTNFNLVSLMRSCNTWRDRGLLVSSKCQRERSKTSSAWVST